MTKEEKRAIEDSRCLIYELNNHKDKDFIGRLYYKNKPIEENLEILLNLIEKLQKENEEVKDILDEKEKEYLSNIIKPFKNKVICIGKLDFCEDRQKEFIAICIKNDYPINLPNFKKNTMYRNMKLCKGYTLEELGL